MTDRQTDGRATAYSEVTFAIIGVIWGDWGHPSSSTMSPFDTAHTTYCSLFTETMHLPSTVFDDIDSYLSKVASFSYQRAFGAFGYHSGISPISSASEN